MDVFKGLGLGIKLKTTWIITGLLLAAANIAVSQNVDLLLFEKPGYKKYRYSNYVQSKVDTVIILDLIYSAQRLIGKRYWLPLDSVTQLLHQAKERSERIGYTMGLIHCAIDLGWAFTYKDKLDSAKYYYKLGLELDDIICNERQLTDHYLYLAWTYRDEHEYDSAAMYMQLVKDIGIEKRDTGLIRSGLAELCRNWLNGGDMLKAARYSFELLELAKIKNDTNDLLVAYWPISNLYSSLGQYDRNMAVVRESLKLVKGTPRTKLKWRVNYMATGAYQQAGKYDSVLYYARLNVPLDDKMKEPRMSYKSMAWAFIDMEQWDSARYYLMEFYKNAIATDQMDAHTYLGLGKCELQLGNSAKAFSYYKHAEEKLETASISTQAKICDHLSTYYSSVGNPARAFSYLERFRELTDSIETKEKKFEAGLEFMEAESKEMEAQIKLLSKYSAINATRAAREMEQKKLVYAGSGVILLFAGLGFVRFRKYKNAKGRKELMNERLRISRDLHDEVGATLSGIAMYSHLAKQQMADANQQDSLQSLETIQQSSGEMVNKLSDIVWLLNPEHDTMMQLVEKLEDYAKRLALTKRMHVRVSVTGNLQQNRLPVESRRNIYLIFKEAINNALKYSNAGNLELIVHMHAKTLEIALRDDGDGFMPTNVKQGNGLLNMQRRAEEIGAVLELNSKPGEGAHVLLQYHT